jgi:hypothetical protein
MQAEWCFKEPVSLYKPLYMQPNATKFAAR